MTSAKREISALPQDTNAALREVIKTVANINDIYQEETEALIAIDSQKFLALQEKKLDRAAAYHAHMTQMIARKDEIKNADPSLRSKLKELQKIFHALSDKNLEALERMQRCTEKLANTIRNAAIRAVQNQRNFSYSMNGTLNESGKNKVISTGLSETA
jgi:prefoldin subunit 5